MALVNHTSKGVTEQDNLPERPQEVKDNPQDYYLNANQEWVRYDESVLMPSWLFGHSGTVTPDQTSSANLSWFGPSAGPTQFTNHPAAPTVHNNNQWVSLKNGWIYEIETHLVRNDSHGSNMGFGVFSGGIYGSSGDPAGMPGSVIGYGAQGDNIQSYEVSHPSHAIVTGNNSWWRICTTAGATITIYAGNTSYGYSHSIIRCLGRA